MSNRFLKEIDSFTESSSKLRSIIALPHTSNSQSTSLQLEASEKTLSLPQIRGQLSTLKAKINTVDSQVKGESPKQKPKSDKRVGMLTMMKLIENAKYVRII
ncbi:MAG: hypothetical protein NT027_20495 [Proteobacteria bacterium]|nr:hypothetical protein [Pseudomonadota bacterium]